MVRKIILAILGVSFVVFLIVVGANYRKSNGSEEALLAIPEMRISLKNVTLDEIKTNDKSIRYDGNELVFVAQDGIKRFEDVEIKGRGNSTWGLPKLPFQIKFSGKTDLLGLGAARKWALLANYLDVTNLRNDIAFKLANMLGEEFATMGEFVKLFIDDEDLGLYYLTHKIEVAKSSVNLKDYHGVLMEIDNLHRDTEECYLSEGNNCLVFKDAVMEDDEEVLDEAIDEFLACFSDFEKYSFEKDYNAVLNSIDVESVARYYLVNEFTANPDAYSSSYYFYKDGVADKLHMGPVWDFDLALSNKVWSRDENEKIFSPYELMARRERAFHGDKSDEGEVITKMVYYLLETPEFKDEIRKMFKEKMSGKGDELLKWIQDRRDYIRDEAISNAEMWEIGNFDEETNYLIDWVKKRYEYFERVYGREELFE